MTLFYDRIQEICNEKGKSTLSKAIYGRSGQLRIKENDQYISLTQKYQKSLGFSHLFLVSLEDKLEFFSNPVFLEKGNVDYYKSLNRLEALKAELRCATPLSIGQIYEQNKKLSSSQIEQNIRDKGGEIFWLPDKCLFEGILVDEFYHSDFEEAVLRPLTFTKKPYKVLDSLRENFNLGPIVKKMDGIGFSFVHLFKENKCVFRDGLDHAKLNSFLFPKVRRKEEYRRFSRQLKMKMSTYRNRNYLNLDEYELIFSVLRLKPKYFIPKGCNYNRLDDVVL